MITPWFGTKFDKEKYKQAQNEYEIDLTRKQLKGGFLVIEMTLDLKETKGVNEFVIIKHGSVAIVDTRQEDFEYLENTTFQRKYNTTKKLTITFWRNEMDKVSVNFWKKKRMTGFRLMWHIENAENHFSDSPSNLTKYENENFINWMNVVFKSTENGWSLAGIWDLVKKVKQKTTRNISKNHYCKQDKTENKDATKDIISSIILELNNVDISSTEKEKNGYYSDKIYKTGFEMFLFLVYCPTPLNVRIANLWASPTYADLLVNFSYRTIILTIMNHQKKKIATQKVDHLIETALMKKLDENIGNSWKAN